MVGTLLQTEDDIPKAGLSTDIVDDKPEENLFLVVGDI